MRIIRRAGLLAAGDLLLANTQWRSLSAVVTIDPRDGHASRLSPRDGAAWTLLDNNNGGRINGIFRHPDL